MSDHGKLQNIYRIVGHEVDDIDLTRAQAVRLYQQLRVMLFPRSTAVTPKSRKRKTK